jgi:hypothetical protein
MASVELAIDRHPRALGPLGGDAHAASAEHAGGDARPEHAERAARATLKAQVARLERELSQIVASRFPHIPGSAAEEQPQGHRSGGARLLTLGELERQRDELALRIRVARIRSAERAEIERRSRALLEEMKRVPHKHKFVRLPVADLGEGRCGFWQVRPRLGVIGMLAGWWEVKLSSGCP